VTVGSGCFFVRGGLAGDFVRASRGGRGFLRVLRGRCPVGCLRCGCSRAPESLNPCLYVPASLTRRWEILWFYALLFGQFHGFTHQLNGQFQGIPLEKSQPDERTFAGCAAPVGPTFHGPNAPSKPTFCLILHHLSEHPTPNARMQVFDTPSARLSAASPSLRTASSFGGG